MPGGDVFNFCGFDEGKRFVGGFVGRFVGRFVGGFVGVSFVEKRNVELVLMWES